MLSAQSGLVDFLKPNGAIGADKRPAGAGQDSGGLFGDTLRGQMSRSDAAREARPEEAKPRPAAREERSDATAPRPDQAKVASDEPEQAASAEEPQATESVSDTTVPLREIAAQSDEVPVERAQSDGLLLAMLPDEQESGDELLAEEAGGKELPLALPWVAAEEGEGGLLPRRWPLQAMERARAGGTANQSQHSPAALAEMTEQLTADDDVLQGLRAALGQRSGTAEAVLGDGLAKGPSAEVPFKLAEMKPSKETPLASAALAEMTEQLTADDDVLQGLRAAKGQSAEALFKLAGMALSKEVPLAPVANAAASAAAPLTSLMPAAGVTTMPQLALEAPLRQPGWDQAFAERVVWLARQGMQQAEIQLNPRNLGPIEVHVSVDKDQASVTFVAQHAVTREALEAALPRLREMLQGNGLNLAQSEVSQHSFGQQQREAMGSAGEHGRNGRGDAEMAEADEHLLGETTLESGRALSAVDYYA